MAITLDELLGRNTKTIQPSVERFPSYEEFQSSRMSSNSRVEQEPVRYNFDMAPAQSLRTAESVRNYEQNRPYITPQSSEYQARDYAFYQNLQPQQQVAPMQQVVAQPVMMQPVIMAQPVQQVAPIQQVVAKPQVESETLYQFTAQESSANEQELFDRLSLTSMPSKTTQRTSVFQRRMQKTESKAGEKQHAKLNIKGKLIIGAYMAVIAIVVALIAVNATKINQGEALQPAGNIQDTSIVQMK